MKTISIRLDDALYEELNEMLNAMGQTKQTFYESFTRTALRERGIPFIISAPVKTKSTGKSDKLEAFARLEAARKLFSESKSNVCPWDYTIRGVFLHVFSGKMERIFT
jgi:antitoxin component of RelBE/YafQ-DinJ toxin-antitoxin module